MMKILSHRGWWMDFESESNKRISFERSFDAGFGTETDLRDICGRIVISHDMPAGDEISFEELLQVMDGRNLPLALNIKADGMSCAVQQLLEQYGQTEYFMFDMSIPELVYEIGHTALTVFTGCSDIVKIPPMYKKSAGIWLDSFYKPWYSVERIQGFLEEGKKVCIVSEDLHGRDYNKQWKMLKESGLVDKNDMMLCTNYPEKAKEFLTK